MQYLHTYKEYKIYEQGDMYYALRSYGKEVTANQTSYKGVQKYIAPSLSLLNDMIDNKRKPNKIKLEQIKLF
jgi:hypothetical protein